MKVDSLLMIARMHKLLQQLMDTDNASTIQNTYFERSPEGKIIRYDVRIDISMQKEEFDESSEMEK